MDFHVGGVEGDHLFSSFSQELSFLSQQRTVNTGNGERGSTAFSSVICAAIVLCPCRGNDTITHKSIQAEFTSER